MAADSLRSSPVPALRDDDHVRGEGPLVLLYADFSCPRCALAWERLHAAPVRIVLRHLALKAKHPRALALAHAVEAAGRQGRFWELVEAIYADQGRIDDPHLWTHLERMGVDLERWEADRRSEEVAIGCPATSATRCEAAPPRRRPCSPTAACWPARPTPPGSPP